MYILFFLLTKEINYINLLVICCVMNAEKKLDKIAKYLSDNMVSEEREELFAWIEKDTKNKVFFEEALEVWEAAAPPERPLKVNTDAAWSNMERRVVKKQQLEEVQSTLDVVSIIRPLLRIAAVAIFIVMTALWYFRDYETSRLKNPIVFSAPIETTTIDLPDGSKVWLNKKSVLKYEKLFEQRIVELEGEAFFEIAKRAGQSFEIYAGDSKTSVLGTSFNVRAYPTESFVEVAVATGTVQFEANNQQEKETVLTKNQYATYSKVTTEISTEARQQENAINWKHQELYLEGNTIGEVIDPLKRYFNIKIEVTNPTLLKCDWKFDKTKYLNPDLDTIIELLNFGGIATFEKINATTLRVSGKNCGK